jgi:hypothetical protein
VALGLCLVLAAIAYFPALGNGFYNDDALFLNHAGRALEQPSALFSERPLNYFRPTWGAWVTAQRALFDLAPAGYYAVGILLHGLTGFLVFLLGRRLLREPLAALAGALAFVAFYSQAEATLWIAAQNSSLMAALAVLCMLSHLRAVDSRKVSHALLTALLVGVTLLCKEPGLFALPMMLLLEVGLHGPRSCISKAGLLRWAVVLPVVVAYALYNPRLTEAFMAGGAAAETEVRAALGEVTPARMLGAAVWLFSPVRHMAAGLNWLWGAAVLGGALLLVGWLRRERLRATLVAAGVLLVGMVPACVTLQQQANGSRLYYLPTVGAALLVACVASALVGPGASRGRRALGAVLLAGYLVVQVRAIHALNARDYNLISRLQVRTAEQFGEHAPGPGEPRVLLLEPWIDNPMHLREFLFLYHGVARGRVAARTVERRDWPDWIAAVRAADPDVVVLDWSDAEGFVPASALPPKRMSAQGKPRADDGGARTGTLNVMRIAPPRDD